MINKKKSMEKHELLIPERLVNYKINKKLEIGNRQVRQTYNEGEFCFGKYGRHTIQINTASASATNIQNS